VVRYSLLPRLTVLAPTAAEAVRYAGGWLFDQVLAGYWASANRDAGEFDAPDTFDPAASATGTSRSAPARTAASAPTWPG
jgi:hypothetical protein